MPSVASFYPLSYTGPYSPDMPVFMWWPSQKQTWVEKMRVTANYKILYGKTEADDQNRRPEQPAKNKPGWSVAAGTSDYYSDVTSPTAPPDE